MESRKVFIDTLVQLAKKDDKVCLIVCDVGFSLIEEFKKKFPNRYFNFGVTEQSAVLIATALALAGFKPYVYSMINFVVFRTYEMVRNGIGMHKANVKLIGVSGAEKYKFYGFSHNMIHKNEDVEVLKHLPIKIYVPTSEKEVREAIIKSYKEKKSTYIRL